MVHRQIGACVSHLSNTIGPPRSTTGVVCACAPSPRHRSVKVVTQKVTSLREAIAVILELDRTYSLNLHYACEDEEWEIFREAIEYLRVAKFVE